uniref:Uncharacterized protein n=1 Tax=Anguilla anguilla TaxID=7936 RepID=A0A0E9XHF0_ANGAN
MGYIRSEGSCRPESFRTPCNASGWDSISIGKQLRAIIYFFFTLFGELNGH